MKKYNKKTPYFLKISLLMPALFCCVLYPQSVFAIDYYKGVPYVVNPLGEGENSKYDSHPLFREDGFDCTTYVETVLAHHKQNKDNTEFMENLVKLRYINGEIGFFSRAHVMEVHWIPNAIKYNFIAEYPMPHTLMSELVFPLRYWFVNHKMIKNKDSNYMRHARSFPRFVSASIPFVPVEYINKEFLRTLPEFMVVFFLRKPPRRTFDMIEQYASLNATQVTHMGLLKKGKLYHASIRQKKVVVLDLLDYLKEVKNYVGISFYIVR